MVICSFLPLEKETITSTYLYGGVKVRCRVVAYPLSVKVHILDGSNRGFRTRRFTANTFVGVNQFQSLVSSIKDEPFELQSLAIAHLLARTSIETLSANELLMLYNTYSPNFTGW